MIGDMKVLVTGATGRIGSAVASALEASHQVAKGSRRGPVKVDMEDPSSLDALFDEILDPDAVVCCAASGPLVDLEARRTSHRRAQSRTDPRARHRAYRGPSSRIRAGVLFADDPTLPLTRGTGPRRLLALPGSAGGTDCVGGEPHGDDRTVCGFCPADRHAVREVRAPARNDHLASVSADRGGTGRVGGECAGLETMRCRKQWPGRLTCLRTHTRQRPSMTVMRRNGRPPRQTPWHSGRGRNYHLYGTARIGPRS